MGINEARMIEIKGGNLVARTAGTFEKVGDSILLGFSEELSNISPFAWYFNKLSEYEDMKRQAEENAKEMDKKILKEQEFSNEHLEKLVEVTEKKGTTSWKSIISLIPGAIQVAKDSYKPPVVDNTIPTTPINKSALSLIPGAISGNTSISSNRDDLIKATYAAFRNAGFSDSAAKAWVGEIGRENSFRPDKMFGRHIDPKNKAENMGIISWQGPRSKDLFEKMSQAAVS